MPMPANPLHFDDPAVFGSYQVAFKMMPRS